MAEDDDDRLAQHRKEAALAFGLPESAAARLRGGSRTQLFDDARELRAAAPLPGDYPSFDAAVHAARRDREQRNGRLFGGRK
jgi:hypothetical protein